MTAAAMASSSKATPTQGGLAAASGGGSVQAWVQHGRGSGGFRTRASKACPEPVEGYAPQSHDYA